MTPFDNVVDWYPGTIPPNIRRHESAYVGSSFTFRRFRSQREGGLWVGPHASLCDGSTLDVGPAGRVQIGAYAGLNSTVIVCDTEVTIGDYALIAWGVVIMDSYRFRQESGTRAAAAPVRICRRAWIGFGACILPGVTVGEEAVIGARAVVTSDVPAGGVALGNPARIVHRESSCERGPPSLRKTAGGRSRRTARRRRSSRQLSRWQSSNRPGAKCACRRRSSGAAYRSRRRECAACGNATS